MNILRALFCYVLINYFLSLFIYYNFMYLFCFRGCCLFVCLCLFVSILCLFVFILVFIAVLGGGGGVRGDKFYFLPRVAPFKISCKSI